MLSLQEALIIDQITPTYKKKKVFRAYRYS